MSLDPAYRTATRLLLVEEVGRTHRRARRTRRLAPVAVGLATVTALAVGQALAGGFGTDLVQVVRAAAGLVRSDQCLDPSEAALELVRYLPDPAAPAALPVTYAGGGTVCPQSVGDSRGSVVFAAAELAADGEVLAGLTVDRLVDAYQAPAYEGATPSYVGGPSSESVVVRNSPATLELVAYQAVVSWTDGDGVSWWASAPTRDEGPGVETAAVGAQLVQVVDQLSISGASVAWPEMPASWTVLLADPPPLTIASENTSWNADLGGGNRDDPAVGGSTRVSVRVYNDDWGWQRCIGSGKLGNIWIVPVGDGLGCLGDNGVGREVGGLTYEIAPGITAELFGSVAGSIDGLPAVAESLVPAAADDSRITSDG